MPAPATATEFLQLVRKSALLEPAMLDDFLAEYGVEAATDATPKSLARTMIKRGLITNLQASLLLTGKWKKFIISGKYKLLELLGKGGMGQVFLCEHSRMRRRVAIKILPTDKATDYVCLQRFEREARAAAALNHPNIVRAHDIDRDGDLHFIVMEYVDGASLKEIVEHVGALSIDRAAHYIAQACLGLQHACEAGLIHRDIKPGNLLVDRSGLVKILDLGLVNFQDGTENLTRYNGSRGLIGTADYLAPEQARDSHVADIRSDLYSLGVTFYYLLTGRSPFREGTVAQKLLYHQTEKPLPIQQFRPEIPEALAKVVEKLLEKDPGHRYQTPAELFDALEPWTSHPIPAPGPEEMPKLCLAARLRDANSSRASAVVDLSAVRLRSATTPTPGKGRRRSWPIKQLALAAALMVAGIGVGVVLSKLILPPNDPSASVTESVHPDDSLRRVTNRTGDHP